MRLFLIVSFSFFPIFSNADLVAGNAPILQTSTLSETMKNRHSNACDNISWMTLMRKSTCMAAIEKVTDTTYEYCSSGKPNPPPPEEIVKCLKDASGRDYPMDYLKACGKAVGSSATMRKECLDYLANSKSVYDNEVFALCVQRSGNNFRETRSCLNAIRDRQVNTRKILEECKDVEGLSKSVITECIEDRTDGAAVSCATGTAAATKGTAAKTGQH